MRINGFQCDDCEKVCNTNEFKGWLFVRDHETNSGYNEFHLCSLECLMSWAAKKQKTILPETGGPVIALGGEEYERLFGKGDVA